MNSKKNHLLALLCTLVPLGSYGATFNVSNTSQLMSALAQAKSNGPSIDTIRFDGGGGWHSDGGRAITVDTPVIIDGVSPTRTLLYNANNRAAVFNIKSSNVTIKNFRIHTSSASSGRSQAGTIGIFILDSYWNITITGNDFWFHENGIANYQGRLPKNITINNNRFFDCLEASIGFVRDAGRTPDPLNGGRVTIKNNWMRGGKRGIILDNGNDGAEVVNGQLVGKGASSYVGSVQHSPFSTVYTEGSIVEGNTVLSTTRTSISFAKVSNIDIKGNTVSFDAYRAADNGIGAIHLEHRTTRVRVENNTVTVNGNAGYNPPCINITNAFYRRDTAFGCTNIFVINNTLRGDSWGLAGTSFRDCHFFRNDFSALSAKAVTWQTGLPNTIGINWGNISLPNQMVNPRATVGSL